MTITDTQITARKVIARLSPSKPAAEEITPNMRIKDELGIDSLRFIRLILEIESFAARKIFTVDRIAQIRTVADLDQVLSE